MNPNDDMNDDTKDIPAPKTDPDMKLMMTGFGLIFVMLALLVAWPYTRQFIPGLADPAKEQVLGTVQQVRFVGGLGTRTEVQVGGRTLLLRGAVEIDRQSLVLRRVTVLDEQLCVVGTQRCHEIVSR